MYYISSNKSPWWCAQCFSCFHRPLVMFWYVFECTPHILKYSRSGLTLILKLPAWKELLVTQKIIKTRRVQDTVNIWCVAARKLCLIVYSQVMIWSCTLSYKNSHQHFYAFNTILVPFWQYLGSFKYELDFNNFAITLQPSRNKELCPFPILSEKYRVLQLLWCKKSQSSWRFFMFFPTKIWFVTFLSDGKNSISNL